MITLDEAIENLSDLLNTYRLLVMKGKKENTEYFEKYRRGYQAFKKKKEKEQNND